MKKQVVAGILGFNIAETTRVIEIAKALKDDFEFTMISYGGEYDHLVEKAGFKLMRLEPEDTKEKAEFILKLDRMETFGDPYSVEELTQRIDNEVALLQTIKPVFVLLGSVLTLKYSSRIVNIPLVNVFVFPLTPTYIKNHLPIVPEYPKWLNRMFGFILLNIPFYMKNFNKVAKRYGLPKYKSIMHLWSGDFNYYTEYPTMFKQVTLSQNEQFVGPIFAHLDNEIPDEVKLFAEDRSKPLVYFAMGSSANFDVLKQVIEYLGGLPIRLIAPIKRHVENKDVEIPDNMLVTDWLPALVVNQMVDFGIVHGGQGTIQTANRAGMPFLGIGMQAEQSLNIEQSRRYGSALRISRRKLNKKRFQKAVYALIENPEYKEKALELKKEAEQFDGSQYVAEILRNKF